MCKTAQNRPLYSPGELVTWKNVSDEDAWIAIVLKVVEITEEHTVYTLLIWIPDEKTIDIENWFDNGTVLVSLKALNQKQQ